MDNLGAHRATDVLLLSLAHPRWAFVFQPTYAAYLNLIEPRWKALKSLALKGRVFKTWDEVCGAVDVVVDPPPGPASTAKPPAPSPASIECVTQSGWSVNA